MTQENVEVVREVCAYWERGDWAARRELFDPDLEAVFSASSFPDAGTYHGRRSAVDAWGRWLDAWEEFSLEVGDVIDAGAAIVVLIRIRGRGKGSGAAVDADVGIIFECDRDVITRMVFCDRQRALEAAGLSG